MNREKLIEIIEGISPSSTAEEWDNCGWQLKTGVGDIYRVLVSLEVTESVIREAAEEGADLILTHHPMLFSGIRRVSCDDVTGNYILQLAKAGISVYSCHTSFDKAEGGNNDCLGRLLGLEDIGPFSRDNGFCRKGDTPAEMTLMEVIHNAAEAFGIDERHFRYVGDPASPVRSIGWCTGAGSEFLQDAAAEGCDLYITGDLKYHEAQLAKEMGLCVLDAGHYGTEKIFTENMADLLREALDAAGETQVEIMESVMDLNPFR
ncbi:MAG: Nif3-like dinuclear metal center hexameric protein [Emergencia sp.]